MRFNGIGNGRFSALLTRALWVKGADAAAPSLADEITPTFAVGDPQDQSLPYLRGERLAAGWSDATAPVLNYPNITLVNPLGSNVLCVLQRWSGYSTAVGSLYTFAASGYLGTTIPSKIASFRDVRWGTIATQPTCGVRSFSDLVDPNVQAVYALEVIRFAALEMIQRTTPIVLPPGSVFSLVNAAAASQLLGNFEWIERPIAAEELATG